jgi:perosamine synthetase
VRTRHKRQLLAAAASEGIELGVWFEGPLHPMPIEPSALEYPSGACPVGEALACEVVNLPTHPRLSDRDIARVVAVVRRVTGP